MPDAEEYLSLDGLEARIDTHRRYSETPDDVEAAVLAATGLTGSESLVDIGCGTGDFLRTLAARGHSGTLVGVDAVAAHGIAPVTLPRMRVHSDNLPDLVRAAFGNVTVHRYDNALVFATPEPLVRYAVATLSFFGVGACSPARPAIIASIESRARTWFAGADGPWRDPKGYVVCTAIAR